MAFTLDQRLQNDCLHVCDLSLCRVLLMNDCQYPWLILVPRVADIAEIIDLTEQQQQTLWRESAQASRVLQSLYSPDKLNVAALGNVVAQCHVHHIARFHHDPAWPAPVWGQHPVTPYAEDELAATLDKLKLAFNPD
ncbi:HIT domain-containing protein [Aestuariibacter salexigens]|uniref:HIT domain-containing protein n=1 Tax=Aestuariibacter salexigens TaxID=226010 RepID=UPI000410475B|nr:HIT domain-containing protein [Aestuariibacter salexigens]